MKVAIDITPIKGELQGHKVRGVGFYLEYLKRSLLEYFPTNEYIFFSQDEPLPTSVDVVHYPYFEPFFPTLRTSKKHISVVTVHDLTPLVFPNHFPSGIRGRLRWIMQKRALQQVDRVIADSYSSKKDIGQIGGIKDHKIDVVYLAAADEFHKIEKGVWKRNLREKYQLPEKFVLYTGDVTWNKNLPNLMRAIKEVNVTLVMVGKTLAEKKFDRSNEWNADLVLVNDLAKNDKRFMRLGFIPTNDLVGLYNTATVFAFPSLYEGFGMPILEAMQCGCPVVTTKGGSLTEIGGDAAMYVDGYDISSIANGISQVFFDSRIHDELIKKGYDNANRFSWKRTAEQTIESYKKALE